MNGSNSLILLPSAGGVINIAITKAMFEPKTIRIRMMKAAVFQRTTLSMMLTLALTACGGGGSNESNNSGGETADPVVNCSSAADAPAACDLRMYQVMVESFVNGDDSINYNTGYGPSNHKGDLQGVIDSLDYIKSLNVNAIWLTPVFDSCKSSVTDKQLAATGYFSCDYFNVDPNFGTNQKLKELVDAAHAKGLYVILDGVFGHAITNDLPAAPVSGVKPVMAKASTGYTVDYTQANSITYFTEVATHYITEYGIDGWRLDQAYQVPTKTWNSIRTAVEAAAAKRKADGATWGTLGYMVGEVWQSQAEIATNAYGSASLPGLKSAFDFPLRYGLVQTFAVEEATKYGTVGDVTQLYTSWNDGDVNPDFAMPNLMLGNHDLLRFGDLLQRGKLAEPSEPAYWARHKAAFSFMASRSGPITFYYGDEIGDEMPGFSARERNPDDGKCILVACRSDDNMSRTTAKIEGVTGFSPSADQVDLKAYLSELLSVRSQHPALYAGKRTQLKKSGNLYAELKTAGDDKVLYVLNAGTTDTSYTVASSTVGGTTDLTNLMTGSVVALADNQYQISVPALTGLFLSVK
jgi:cyclomaltodextrinase / maltogenic alpha-amylase / neopullulanase